jgi:hypothetical protein
MSFQPVYRGMLAESTNPLHRGVAQALGTIDAKAAEMRRNDIKSGARRSLPVELAPLVEELKARMDRARIHEVIRLGDELETLKTTWTKDRDKNPQAETAQLLRAANRFKASSDEAVAELSMGYASGAADLSSVELNEARSRLRESGQGAELETLNLAAKARHGDTPWIAGNADAMAMVQERDVLKSLPSGTVSLADDQHRVKLSDLVDFNGDLDKS